MTRQINTIKELLENTEYKSEKDIDWIYISASCELSEFFIEKHNNKMSWNFMSECQTLSEEFIERYKDKVSWYWILKSQVLSENFIRKHENKISSWSSVSKFQILSESFIEEYKDLVDWINISKYQILSEPFIEKYKNKVDWFCVACHQILSEPFIEKYKNKIDLRYAFEYQDVSKYFIKKYKNEVDLDLYYYSHISFIKKWTKIQKFAEKNNLYYDSEYIYGYTDFTSKHRLLDFNKPTIYNKVNYYYKCYLWEAINLKNKKEHNPCKLLKIKIKDIINTKRSLPDWIYVKGFTIIDNLPKKENINRYKLIEI